jgi:DNA replication and repair protein RecF
MIDSIWIKSFRTLTELSISFRAGPFFSVISKNNVGKTSILEACYILGHLASFSTNNISDIVPFDGDASYMGIKLFKDQRHYNYYLKVDKDGKKYINLNERPVRKKSDIQSLFRTEYISSDSLLLITSQPAYRRMQIDNGIAQCSTTYQKNMAAYKRLVFQKNKALKDGGGDYVVKQLNEQLVPLIDYIQRKRLSYLKDIERRVQWYLGELDIIDGHFNFDYVSRLVHLSDPEHLYRALDSNLAKEKMMKMTNIGPHRDDFVFNIDKRNVKLFYSRGIGRILAYFFQLAQAITIEESTGLPMLLLLDEPFSEIHHQLKDPLIKSIPSPFYVLYMSTQKDELTQLKHGQTYSISKGTLCKI